jgi:hypothetical protein
MPRTIRCPNHPDANCTIPDPTLVLSKDGISLVRSDLAEHLINVAEPQRLRLRPLPISATYGDLVADAGDPSTGLVRLSPTPEHERLLASVGPTGRSVVVNCTCGETFVADV